jgi:hypothetical protein
VLLSLHAMAAARDDGLNPVPLADFKDIAVERLEQVTALSGREQEKRAKRPSSDRVTREGIAKAQRAA